MLTIHTALAFEVHKLVLYKQNLSCKGKVDFGLWQGSGVHPPSAPTQLHNKMVWDLIAWHTYWKENVQWKQKSRRKKGRSARECLKKKGKEKKTQIPAMKTKMVRDLIAWSTYWKENAQWGKIKKGEGYEFQSACLHHSFAVIQFFFIRFFQRFNQLELFT